MKINPLNHSRLKCFWLAFFLSMCCLPMQSLAKGVPTKQPKQNRVMGVERLPALDINQLRAWISNQGVLLQAATSGPGLEWPINSGKTIAFMMAPWLACQFEGDTSDIRTAAVRNIIDGSEFVPGKILQNPDGTIEPDNPNLSKYRIYRIQRGDDANSNPDYRDWPFEDGAPYEALQKSDGSGDSLDAFGKPVPKLDQFGNKVPKLFGDQTTWCVYNDMRQDGRIFSAQPMGCEIRQTAFAYQRAGALGRMIFFRFEIINKHVPDPLKPNKGRWKNCYIGIFSDHDVGNLVDDLVGCDTSLGLGFTYNASNSDQVYGQAPPAIGVDFFQGPIVKRQNGLDTLNATGFVRFNNTVDAADADPQSGKPREVYNYFLGRDRFGNPLPGVVSGSKFMYPADPESNPSSPLVEPFADKNDKRHVLSTGPFDMAAGDTQVVYCAVLVARGTSHVNSVTELKKTDEVAQGVFDAGFQIPYANAPKLSVTELDQALVLNWLDPNPNNPSYTPALEQGILTRPGAEDSLDRYEFQGYVLYQYRSVDGKEDAFKPIRVFDKKDGITDIISETEVELNGQTQTVVATVIQGTDSGVKHNALLQKDEFGNKPFINGRRYYFGLTAYYINPYQLEKSPYPDHPNPRTAPAYLESLDIPLVAIPQKPVSTIRLPYEPEDEVQTQRLKFGGDDNVRVDIINPLTVKSGNYEVRIIDEFGSLWQLVDLSNNGIARNELDQTMDSLVVSQQGSENALPQSYYGVHITVKQSPLGLRTDGQQRPYPLSYEPIENRFFLPKAMLYKGYGPSETNLAFQSSVMGSESGNGAIWYPVKNLFTGTLPGSTVKPEDLKPVEIEFTHDIQKQQLAYRYVLNINPAQLDVNQPLAKMIYEPSFGAQIDTTGSPLIQQFKKSAFGPFQENLNPHPKVPFRVFELDPETGERLGQLHVLITERNDPFEDGGSVDGAWNPNASLSGGQELICITATRYNPDQPDTLISTYRYTDKLLGTPRLFARDQDKLDIQYMLWLRQDTDGNGNPKTFKEGDRIVITPNYKLTPATVYRFELEGIQTGNEIAKQHLDKIGVFPNPYFGYSMRERSVRETLVTFNNLPPTCTIRIFTLNGELVRTIRRKESHHTSLEDWNLKNQSGVPVASGMYIVHVETPVGSKVLKLAIVQRENRENNF